MVKKSGRRTRRAHTADSCAWRPRIPPRASLVASLHDRVLSSNRTTMLGEDSDASRSPMTMEPPSRIPSPWMTGVLGSPRFQGDRSCIARDPKALPAKGSQQTTSDCRG
jgi:hypothetical protein